MLRRALTVAVTLAFAAAVAAPAHADFPARSGEELVALLNQQRQTNGIPPVAYSPELADGCAKHNNYLNLNSELDHDEDPAKPGYTPEGRQAGLSSPLASGDYPDWTSTANPWSNMPMHLAMIMNPQIVAAGANESYGIDCMATNHAFTFAAPTGFSVPGNGRTDVNPDATIGGEAPYDPAALVGLHGTVGPQILVFLAGVPSATIASTTMADAGGTAVDTRTIDSANAPAPWGTANGLVVPTKALKPFSAYHLSVDWQFPGGTYQQTVSFTTAGKDNSLSVNVGRRTRGWGFGVSTTAPRPQSIELRGPQGQKRTVRLKPRVGVTGRLTRGTWQACATTGGADTGYEQVSACKSFIVR